MYIPFALPFYSQRYNSNPDTSKSSLMSSSSSLFPFYEYFYVTMTYPTQRYIHTLSADADSFNVRNNSEYVLFSLLYPRLLPIV